MLELAEKAVGFAQGRTRSDLDRDELFALAMVRLVEVIGEAARGVSLDTQRKMPDVPWRDMISARNWLIHGYPDIDFDIVWRILVEHLPLLVAALRPVVPRG